MITADRQPPHHNNLTCYTEYRCRRPECVDRYNAHVRAHRQAKNTGAWNRYIEAEPVRRHLKHLTASGHTLGRIATVTGIPLQTLREINGRRYRTSPDHATRILALTADDITPTRVDATGTRRRLQALVAAGWPLEQIAPHAGLHPRNINNLTRQPRVKATTARTIADTYTRLSELRPHCHGVSRQQVARAKKRAAANRWATPKYWADRMDAIDDPHFEPEYGITRLQLVAEEAHWLITTGDLDRAAAAERLGVSKSYVEHALAQHQMKEAA